MNLTLPSNVLRMLIGGAVSGAVLALLALAAPRLTRRLLFAVLVFAAAMYVVFTVGTEKMSVWIGIELAGVAIYTAMGWRGLKGSPWWLVAGWAAHTVWDVVLHFVGPGHTFAPVTYTIPCFTYDLAVAAIYAVRLVMTRRATPLYPEFTSHPPVRG